MICAAWYKAQNVIQYIVTRVNVMACFIKLHLNVVHQSLPG